MTRDSNSAKSINYMIKAENSLRIAKIAAEQGAYDNAVMSAIHSAINALDALTSFHLDKRSSGAHSSVFSLVKGILADRDYRDIERQFKLLLSLKNVSEYAGKTTMYQLNLRSPITKSIKKLAFEIASKRITKFLAKR